MLQEFAQADGAGVHHWLLLPVLFPIVRIRTEFLNTNPQLWLEPKFPVLATLPLRFLIPRISAEET